MHDAVLLCHMQARTTDVKASAATLDAPVSSPPGAAADGYPTEAARRTAFSEEFTPELVRSSQHLQQHVVPSVSRRGQQGKDCTEWLALRGAL